MSTGISLLFSGITHRIFTSNVTERHEHLGETDLRVEFCCHIYDSVEPESKMNAFNGTEVEFIGSVIPEADTTFSLDEVTMVSHQVFLRQPSAKLVTP